MSIDANQPVEKNVFETPPRVEDGQYQNVAAANPVDHPIRRNDELAILLDMQACKLRHDGPRSARLTSDFAFASSRSSVERAA